MPAIVKVPWSCCASNVDRLCIVQAYWTVAMVAVTVTKLSEGLAVELTHMLSFPSVIVPLLDLPSAPSVDPDPDQLALGALATLHTTAGGGGLGGGDGGGEGGGLGGGEGGG